MKLNGPPQYFDRTTAPRVVASCSCDRMAGADDCPKETRDDYSSKNTGRDCDVRFGCVCDDIAGECPHRAGMQRQIQGRQRQWRAEVDPEGRRLLQRMLQEAEGRGLTPSWARPDVSAAPTSRGATSRLISPPVARACAGPVRETAGPGRTRSSRTGTPA